MDAGYKTIAAKYTIKDTFIVTGRGLVLGGTIKEGVVSNGDYIEFIAFELAR